MVSLLVSHFSEGVNQAANNCKTPLDMIVFQKSNEARIESARILLTLGGADVRSGYTDEPSNWYEPLRRAARNRDEAMCRILVEVGGADPRRVLTTGEDGRPSLMDPVDAPGISEELTSKVLATLCSLAGIDPYV